MGNNKSSDRITPLTTFSLNFAIPFSVVASTSIINEIDKIRENEKIKGISTFLKEEFLRDFFDVKTEKELLSKESGNLEVKKQFRKLKEIILDESALETDEFPKWCAEKVKKFIQEYKK
jgi:hypothetical protein